MPVLEVCGSEADGSGWRVCHGSVVGHPPAQLSQALDDGLTPSQILERALSSHGEGIVTLMTLGMPTARLSSGDDLFIMPVPLRLEAEPLERLDDELLRQRFEEGFPTSGWRVSASFAGRAVVFDFEGDRSPDESVRQALRPPPTADADGAVWVDRLKDREREALAWQLRRLGGNLSAMETEVLRRASIEDPFAAAALGLYALGRASHAGQLIHRAAYQPSSTHPWGLVHVDMSRSRYVDLAEVRAALEDFRANRRASFQAINGAMTAGQVRRAHREQQLQSDIGRVAALVLIPSLIAAFFGANVGLPYRDSALGLILLLALSGSAGLVGLGIVRRRYPPPPFGSAGRIAWRELVHAPGGVAIIAGAALAGVAVLLIIIAIMAGEILPPSKDPIVERLDELIELVKHGR